MEIDKGASDSPSVAGAAEGAGLEPKGVAAFVVALLVPGAGHLLLRRWVRGAVLGGVIVGAFALGLLLHGRLHTVDPSNYLSIFFVFADAGTGLLYLVCLLSGFGFDVQAEVPTFEYGTHLLLVIGLLNYLVALDAYDVAVGRKP